MADDVTLLPLGGEGKALQASFEAYRDAVHARIADLEAQLADARDWSSTLADAADDLRAELREAERELAAIKARRCETCRFRDERGWCEVNARTYPSDGFCSEWEAALLPPDDGRCRSCADAPFCNEDHRRDCLTLHPPKEAADAGS